MSSQTGRLDREQIAFNIDLPLDVDLSWRAGLEASEADLKKAMQHGHVHAADLCAVIQMLPNKQRPLRSAVAFGATLPPLVFGAGAYVHGPMLGLQNNTLNYELPVLAVASVIRSMAPGRAECGLTPAQGSAQQGGQRKPTSASHLLRGKRALGPKRSRPVGPSV